MDDTDEQRKVYQHDCACLQLVNHAPVHCVILTESRLALVSLETNSFPGFLIFCYNFVSCVRMRTFEVDKSLKRLV
jgi:hypothetical protein